jgi:hypothetical protein
MPEEPVYTKYAGYIDAYLIEARSIAGLSGSPVFVNTPEPQVPAGFVLDPKTNPDDISWPNYHFLGLMHGHFDLQNLTEDSVIEDASQGRGINSGMGLVIPASKIIETLFQPELKEMRKKLSRELREKRGATPDFDLSDDAPRSGDANPNHREDFRALLNVAAKKPEPKG